MQHSTSHLSNIYSSSSSIISTKSAVFGLSFFRLILISLTIFIIFVQNSNCLQQRNGNQRIRGLRLSSLNDKSEVVFISTKTFNLKIILAIYIYK